MFHTPFNEHVSTVSHVGDSLTTVTLNEESRSKIRGLLKANTHQLQLPLLVAALISPVFLFQARNMTNDTWAKKSLIQVRTPSNDDASLKEPGSLDLTASREPEAQHPRRGRAMRLATAFQAVHVLDPYPAPARNRHNVGGLAMG